MNCYREGGCGPYEGGKVVMNIQQAKENIKDIPQIKPVDPYPPLVLYADKDGLWYFYTIWHLEQLTRL